MMPCYIPTDDDISDEEGDDPIVRNRTVQHLKSMTLNPYGQWFENYRKETDEMWFSPFKHMYEHLVDGLLAEYNEETKEWRGFLCKQTRYQIDKEWWDAHPEVKCWCDPCCMCEFFEGWTFARDDVQKHCGESLEARKRFRLLFAYKYYRSYRSWKQRSRLVYDDYVLIPNLGFAVTLQDYLVRLPALAPSITIPNLLWAMVYKNNDEVFLFEFEYVILHYSVQRRTKNGIVERYLPRSVQRVTYQQQTIFTHCLSYLCFRKIWVLVYYGYKLTVDDRKNIRLSLKIYKHERWFHTWIKNVLLYDERRRKHLKHCKTRRCNSCMLYGKCPRWWVQQPIERQKLKTDNIDPWMNSMTAACSIQ